MTSFKCFFTALLLGNFSGRSAAWFPGLWSWVEVVCLFQWTFDQAPAQKSNKLPLDHECKTAMILNPVQREKMAEMFPCISGPTTYLCMKLQCKKQPGDLRGHSTDRLRYPHHLQCAWESCTSVSLTKGSLWIEESVFRMGSPAASIHLPFTSQGLQGTLILPFRKHCFIHLPPRGWGRSASLCSFADLNSSL